MLPRSVRGGIKLILTRPPMLIGTTGSKREFKLSRRYATSCLQRSKRGYKHT
ncbi:MAG TPA: hypothetical protein VGR70_09485 [Stellaceae bacterium]|nr:hypothetical protein [Stellaceae bacterium]